MPKFEYTKEHIKSSKLALLIGSLTAAVADVFVVVLLMIAGLWGYVALPIALAVADIAFFVIAIFTNFRFRYSLTYIIGYLAVFIGCVLGHLFIIYGGKETAMTAIALIIWVAVHVLNFLVTLLGAKGAITKKKGHHFLTALVVLLFIGATSIYVAFGATMGYFGQGSTTARPILYVYDEQTGSYTATGVLSGNGTTATIPAEFDGKPVSAIDASLFNATRLNTLHIQTESDIEIKNLDALSEISVAEIFAPRETLTTLQREFYTAYRDMDTKNDLLLTLAASAAPSDLKKDEIYITFSYTDRAMACIGETYLPSWIGTKGDKFDLSELAKEIGYTQQTDVTDEALLHELYTNNTYGGGYILLPIMLDATTPLDGATIQKSHKNVTVDFEKIYRVKIEEDNDTLHSFSDNFDMGIDVNGTEVAYRYVTPTTMSALLPSVTERPGFTLAWDYKYGSVEAAVSGMTNEALFSALDDRNLRDFSVKPTWTMNVPTINKLETNKQSNAFTYGDNVDFTVNAAAPAQGTFLTYEWFFASDSMQNSESNTLNVSPIKMNQAGTYKVVVKAQSDSVTSLTSVSEQTIDLTVAKKGINMSWLFDGEGNKYSHIYDANTHDITVAFNKDDFVKFPSEDASEDPQDFKTLTFEYTCNGTQDNYKSEKVPTLAAGTYAISVALTGASAENYTLLNPEQSYTIDRKSVNVIWTNTTLTYNALEQAPTATANPDDVCAGDTVTITVAGAKTDTNLKVNEQTYEAQASLNDTLAKNANYRLVNETTTQKFTIEPAELSVKWTGDNASENDFEYIYNGQGHRPVAVFTGILYNQNLELTYNAEQINANTNGEHYTATVTVGNKNYFVANANIVLSQTFTVTPKKLTVTWRGENNSTSDFSWIYDAKAHRPIALFTGLVGSDNQNESYNEIEKTINAGTYTATVTVGNTNYYIDDIDKNHEYTIEKRQLSIYNIVQSFVYDATAKYPTYLVDNLVDGTDAGFAFMEDTNAFDKKTNVGTYPCKLVVTNQNYAFTDYEMTLEITKKPLTITNPQTQLVYNSEELFPDYTLNGVCEGDTVGISGASVNITEEGAMVNVGQNYTATLHFESANYSIASSYLTWTFKIVPKTIMIDWGKVDFIYNGEAQKPNPSVVLGELYGLDTVEITVAGEQTNTNAYTGNQKYTATATSQNPNYSISNNQTYFTIAPYTIEYGSIIWYGEDESESDFSWVYDGTVKAPTAKATGVLGENVELRLSAGKTNTNLYTGTAQYDITATSQNKNYVIAEGTDINLKHFTITPKELTVSWTGEDDETPFAWIYSASTHNPVAVFEGKVGSENLNLTYSTPQKNVGEYDATVTVGNKNYFVANETTLIQHFEIVAKELIFTWGTNEFVFDNTYKFPSYEITGYAGTESKNDLKATEVGAKKNAGFYDEVSFVINNANYYIKDDTNLYGTLSITKRVIKPEFNSNTLELTYNGNEQRPSYKWVNTINGYAFEDNVTVTTDNTPKDVNSYELTVTISDPNYEFEGGATEVRQSFQIVKRNLTVSGIVNRFTYDGKEHYPTYTVNNLVQGEDAGFFFNGDMQANAGTYEYTLSITNSNYAFTERSITMTIDKKNVAAVWGNASFTYNGSEQAPTATATDVNGYPFDLIVSGAQTNYRSSAYTASAALPDDYKANYNLTGYTKSFTIAKLAVEVHWDNLTFVYNAISHAPTASATGINDYVVPITVNGAKTAAGTYEATATTTNSNYSLTNATTTFVIEQKEISVVWGNASFIYNGNSQAPTASATGVSGEIVALTVTGAQTNANATGTTYTATASITSNKNYKLTTDSATKNFTIAPAEAEVSWTNTSLTFNGNQQAPTANATGVKGEAIAIDVLGAQTNARTTPYMATATTQNTNYTLKFHQQEFTIGKKTVSVTWSNTSLTFNGNQQAPTATVTGAGGITLSVDVTGAQRNAGSNYTATATLTSSTDMGNYNLENTTVQFSIAKQKITVTWRGENGSATDYSYRYNGSVQKPTATASGVNITVTTDRESRNAGNYTATATITNSADANNYEITNPTKQFTIS